MGLGFYCTRDRRKIHVTQADLRNLSRTETYKLIMKDHIDSPDCATDQFLTQAI